MCQEKAGPNEGHAQNCGSSCVLQNREQNIEHHERTGPFQLSQPWLLLQDQRQGARLFSVPLALDMAVDERGKEADAPELAGAHWTARLTALLLREQRKGSQSRWAPYLQVALHRLPSVQLPLPQHAHESTGMQRSCLMHPMPRRRWHACDPHARAHCGAM